jgi:hypothetical protein
MTVSEMLTILGDRMEDTSGNLFSTTVKERYLNRAQDKLIQLLNPHLLTDLHVLKTGVTLTADTDVDTHFKYYFTPTNAGDLDSDPFGGSLGVMGIRVVNSNFVRKISFDMAKDFTTGLVGFSNTEPVYFIFKGRVYIYNTTANVDVYYVKQPSVMASGVTECDLNAVYHDALLELAELELWRTVNNRERMATAQANAYEYIGKYNQTPATGVIGEGQPFDYSGTNSLVDPIYPNYPI